MKKEEKKREYNCRGLIRDGCKVSHKMVKDSLDKEFGKTPEFEYEPTQLSYESISTY